MYIDEVVVSDFKVVDDIVVDMRPPIGHSLIRRYSKTWAKHGQQYGDSKAITQLAEGYNQLYEN